MTWTPIKLRRRGEIAFIGEAEAPGGGSLPFDPATLPGLALWLDASQLVGLGDGDPIPTFTDLSGNGFGPTQSGGNRPIYKAAVQNGLAVARFTYAGASFMEFPAGALDALFVNWESFTVWLALRAATSDGAGYVLFGSGPSNPRAEVTCSINFDTQDVGLSVSSDDGAAAQPVASAPPTAEAGDVSPWVALGMSWTKDGIGAITGLNTASYYVVPGGPLPATSLSELLLGTDPDVIGGLQADIGEIIVAEGASASVRRAGQEYLSEKWATP